MKKIKILIMAVSLLLTPFVYQVQSAQNPGAPPPVSSVLVRQGDFALSLLEVLGLGTAYSEAQAQEMLVEIGIEPKYGWISDYPMTPDIIGELQDAVGKASDHGYLAMNRSEALDFFQTLVADYGLPISPDYSRSNYSETPPSFGYYNYTEPTVINNYYYHTGPPVVTYYPPPSGYYHLYSWVPYPFWWQSFWFSGYFVLNDFHRTSRVVIFNRYGHKKHFRSHKSVIRLFSNREKRYHHNRKGFTGHPSQGKFERNLRFGSNTSGRRWSKPDKSGARDHSPFLRRGHDQRHNSGNNTVIRGDNRSNARQSFNRSNERFREDKNRQINNRSSKNPGHGNQLIERRESNSRTRIGNNPAKIRRPNNSHGSVNAPRHNHIIRENRRNNSPGIRDNRTTNVRENRNPVVRENRRSIDRYRSFEGNRSFQGRDRSSFQRSDRSNHGSARSWNKGDSRLGPRKFR